MSSFLERKQQVLELFCKAMESSAFSKETLQCVCSTAGKGSMLLLFPDGLKDFILYLEHLIDSKLNEHFAVPANTSKSGLVELAIMDRLMMYSDLPNSDIIVRNLYTFFHQPSNLLLAAKNYSMISDNIWTNIVKDTSTDFNFYSKRLILAGIYPICLKTFCTDKTDGYQHTRETIRGLIAKVLMFAKIKSKIRSCMQC